MYFFVSSPVLIKFCLKLLDEKGFHIYSGYLNIQKIIGGVAAEFGVHFLLYSAIRTGMKTHADHYNIVCEVIHDDNNRLPKCIYRIGGCRYVKREAYSFPVMPPYFPPWNRLC